jgi:hypothetical protein
MRLDTVGTLGVKWVVVLDRAGITALAPVHVLTAMLGCGALVDLDAGDPGSSTSDGGPTTDPAETAGEVETSGGVDTVGVEPGCGNGIVEPGEACDDAVESATCDADCTEVMCGDEVGNAPAGEDCDGPDLAGGRCGFMGFDAGRLACDVGCRYDTSGCGNLPAAPRLELYLSPVKQLALGWAAAVGADHYQLLESPAPGEPFEPLGEDVFGESISIELPLHLRFEASYVLRACNRFGCTESAAVSVLGSLAEAVGYVKASNTDASDQLGQSMALSGDGNTLAVGAPTEDSSATGIDGDQADDSASVAGAVYVFVRDGLGAWSQQAYVKASNTGDQDWFGMSVALSGDGNTLVVGATGEDSDASGIDGDQANDAAPYSGAVYVLVRDGAGEWSQQAYLKASNADGADGFGAGMALAQDGNTLAVGTLHESSSATGIDGEEDDDSAFDAGAVYLFARDGLGGWSQQAYIKGSNTDAGDWFGVSMALSGDGDTLAVGASGEDSSAIGIDGDQADGSAPNAGAVYLFVRDGRGAWSQHAYVKASNTGADDGFGRSVALSEDASTLAVGAPYEDSNATGVGGSEVDDFIPLSGAVYVLVRDGLGRWSQQAYVKGFQTDAGDAFGMSVGVSADGATLVVGAPGEASSAIGIGGNQGNDSRPNAGAVYVLVRDPSRGWSPRAYVKASNTDENDDFGRSVGLSGDARTLAVSAPGEASSATGIGGDEDDDTAPQAGAVYLY